jgi:hypothetical protein
VLTFFWRVAATTRDAFVPLRPPRQAAPSNRGIDQLLSISAMKSTGLLCIIGHVHIFGHSRCSTPTATPRLTRNAVCAQRSADRGRRARWRQHGHRPDACPSNRLPSSRAVTVASLNVGTSFRPPNQIGPFRRPAKEERWLSVRPVIPHLNAASRVSHDARAYFYIASQPSNLKLSNRY